MTAHDLDDICRRGRVFSEMFPGTAASDEWLRYSAWRSQPEQEDRDEQPSSRETPALSAAA